MSGLMVLKERIDATEALIAIDLDNRRNELVAFDLVSDCQANHLCSIISDRDIVRDAELAPQSATLWSTLSWIQT